MLLDTGIQPGWHLPSQAGNYRYGGAFSRQIIGSVIPLWAKIIILHSSGVYKFSSFIFLSKF